MRPHQEVSRLSDSDSSSGEGLFTKEEILAASCDRGLPDVGDASPSTDCLRCWRIFAWRSICLSQTKNSLI